MSDIFISCASEDRERITPLVGLLERRGWSVWWDRTIVSSKTFEEFIEATPDEFIEAALDRTRCVIVVWSHASVVPKWVRSEAAEGLPGGQQFPQTFWLLCSQP